MARQNRANRPNPRNFRIAFAKKYREGVVHNCSRERPSKHGKMAEDSHIEPAIDRGLPKGSVLSASAAAAAGLRPIDRFNSDERLSRIVPHTDTGAVASYCSRFARDFLDANLYFCSAKFTVARGGKVKAIDEAFREAESWYATAIANFAERHQIEFPLAYMEIHVKVTHQFAGRLLRLVRLYDRLFASTMFCNAAGSVSGSEREDTLRRAAKLISQIHLLCIPGNDKFAPDGSRLSTQASSAYKD